MIHSHTCFQGLCAVLAGAALSHADEPAVSISDFGVDKVMSGPVVSINDQYKGVVKIEMDSLTPDYATPWNTGRYQGGIGTGFLIGENAFMTNAHVVSNAERIYISMYGDSRKIPARVKFIAHDADLALLEADDPRPFKGIRPFEFSKNLPHLEDEVRVIGYPIGGNRLSVTRGVVSRIDFTTYAHPRNTEHLTIQVDAAINPGNSGGALFDSYGNVIGVVYAKSSSVSIEGIGYAIPVNNIKELVEQMINDPDSVKDQTKGSQIMLGITIRDITEDMSKQYSMPVGVYITEVSSMSAAERAGLQKGDIITEFAGETVTSADDLNAIKAKQTSGDTVSVKIDRNGKEMTLDLVIPQPTEVDTASNK